MSRKSDLRQARRQAQLQYGPQNSALLQILQGLDSNYVSDTRQAKAAGKMVAASARRAVPELQRAYKPGITGSGAAEKFIASEIANRPEGDAFRAAASVDQGISHEALAHQLTQGVKELVNRKVEARVDTAQQLGAIRGQYQSDRQKTIDQLLGNRKQQGLYTATQFGSLRKDAADRRVTKRGQDVTKRGQDLTHQDKVAARNAAEKKAAQKDAAGAKPKWATPTQMGDAKDAIDAANAAAAKLKKLGLTRAKAAAILQDATAAKQFGVPVLKKLNATAGLDLAYDGRISRHTAQQFRKIRRIRPHKLGYDVGPTPKTNTVDAGPVKVKVPTQFHW